jgi:hypothetical protein
MSTDTLTKAVYGIIFPKGIPFGCKDNIVAIDQRIQEIEILATGKPLVALSAKERSQKITEKIVALKEVGTPMSEIARQMGMTKDACRNRWDDYRTKQIAEERQAALDKEGYAAISGDPQEPTIRDSRIVQESEKVPLQDAPSAQSDPASPTAPEIPTVEKIESEVKEIEKEVKPHCKHVRDLTPSEAGKIEGPRIPHSYDKVILLARSEGQTYRAIAAIITEDGHKCSEADVASRCQKPVKKAAKTTPPARQNPPSQSKKQSPNPPRPRSRCPSSTSKK